MSSIYLILPLFAFFLSSCASNSVSNEDSRKPNSSGNRYFDLKKNEQDWLDVTNRYYKKFNLKFNDEMIAGIGHIGSSRTDSGYEFTHYIVVKDGVAKALGSTVPGKSPEGYESIGILRNQYEEKKGMLPFCFLELETSSSNEIKKIEKDQVFKILPSAYWVHPRQYSDEPIRLEIHSGHWNSNELECWIEKHDGNIKEMVQSVFKDLVTVIEPKD